MPIAHIAQIPYPDKVDDLNGIKEYLLRLYRATQDAETHRPEDLTTTYYSKDNLQTSGKADVHWDNINHEPSTWTPAAHDLTSAYHTDSGLTAGHFLKATAATTFAFGAHGLTYSDVGAAATAHTHQYYAIGDIFITTRVGDPSTLLGYGTWTAIEGQFLVGYKSGDSDFGTVGATGGAKTSTPNAHAGTAVADHPDTPTSDASGTVGPTPSGGYAVEGHHHHVPALAHTVTQPSAHAAMSILPPYLVVYFWLRTA